MATSEVTYHWQGGRVRRDRRKKSDRLFLDCCYPQQKTWWNDSMNYLLTTFLNIRKS